jgi:hypothetical protein
MFIFSKASDTKDEKIRIVNITTCYYSLCSLSVRSTFYVIFKKQNKTKVCLFKTLSHRLVSGTQFAEEIIS